MQRPNSPDNRKVKHEITTPLLDEVKAAQMSGDRATRTITDEEGKYLTFKLAEEEYGVEILKAREINGLIHCEEAG